MVVDACGLGGCMSEVEDRVRCFVAQQKALLDLELGSQLADQAEYLTRLTKQQLQQRGVALFNLREASRATGLAGKLYACSPPAAISMSPVGL